MLALIPIHAEIKGAYGNPRMMRERRARGLSVSQARVARRMRAQGIWGRHQRRYQDTTDAQHRLPVADHLLARDLTPSGPHRVWSADITYLWTDEGGY